MIKFKYHRNSGFSMIELSIAILVLGMIIGIITTILSQLQSRGMISENYGRQAEVTELVSRAMSIFVTNDYRLPCPDINGDGREDLTGPQSARLCLNDKGGVPYRSLKISQPKIDYVYHLSSREYAENVDTSPAIIGVDGDLAKYFVNNTHDYEITDINHDIIFPAHDLCRKLETRVGLNINAIYKLSMPSSDEDVFTASALTLFSDLSCGDKLNHFRGYEYQLASLQTAVANIGHVYRLDFIRATDMINGAETYWIAQMDVALSTIGLLFTLASEWGSAANSYGDGDDPWKIIFATVSAVIRTATGVVNLGQSVTTLNRLDNSTDIDLCYAHWLWAYTPEDYPARTDTDAYQGYIYTSADQKHADGFCDDYSHERTDVDFNNKTEGLINGFDLFPHDTGLETYITSDTLVPESWPKKEELIRLKLQDEVLKP